MSKYSLLIVLLLSAAYSYSEESIEISQTVKAAKNDCAERILRRAYQNIGVKLSFNILPTKRALHASNLGITDGETARMEGVAKDYTNLIQIPVPVCLISFHIVFIKDIKISKLEDLNKYFVGVVRGHLAAEKLAENYNTTKAADVSALIQMLERNRVDAIIVSNSRLTDLKLSHLKDKITVVDLPDETKYLYHYLNKLHADIAARLTTEMKRLEAHGFTAIAIAEHETYAQEQERLQQEAQRQKNKSSITAQSISP